MIFMVVIGTKCIICLEEFDLDERVASWKKGNQFLYSHISCLSKCSMPSCYVSFPPKGISGLLILEKAARTGNSLLRLAFWALNGPNYKVMDKLPYGFSDGGAAWNKDLNYPESTISEDELICSGCVVKDRNKYHANLRETNRERKKVRQKEKAGFIASHVHLDLVELYVNDIIPKRILLLITKWFPKTAANEPITELLKSILRYYSENTQNKEWSKLDIWNEPFELICKVDKMSNKQNIDLDKILSCIFSDPNYINNFDSNFFGKEVHLKLEKLMKWANDPETQCIFDGIFSVPKKTSYDEALELLENGFEGQPEALMEVIEGGEHWEVVALRHGFYQL
jgi:hypothetical protein